MKDQVGGLVFLSGPAIELDGVRNGWHCYAGNLGQRQTRVQQRRKARKEAGIATGNRTPIMRMRTACPNR